MIDGATDEEIVGGQRVKLDPVAAFLLRRYLFLRIFSKS